MRNCQATIQPHHVSYKHYSHSLSLSVSLCLSLSLCVYAYLVLLPCQEGRRAGISMNHGIVADSQR
jgi:hypothetical protein